MTSRAAPFPPFDDSRPLFWDDDDQPRHDPFARCEHALSALRAGDSVTALTTLSERLETRDLADVIGGEAADLIRSGRLSDAERRLECAVAPKFASQGAAAAAYGKAIAITRHARLAALLNAHGLEFAA